MNQKELAALLDISPAMVSRLKKQGMPVDTLERAQRWRKRHLEPGRIKGSRFDPNRPKAAPTPTPTPTPTRQPARAAPPAQPGRPAAALPGELAAEAVASVEAAAVELDQALASDDQAWAAAMVPQVRQALRHLTQCTDPDDQATEPRLSLRVWLALCDYALTFDDAATGGNPAALMTPSQFAQHHRPGHTYQLKNHHILEFAADWNDYAANGWPSYPDDDEADKAGEADASTRAEA
jgi:hypothetical protein